MCRVAQALWNHGEAAGENRMAKLIKYLLSQGLIGDVQLAVSDENARKEMYVKYKIEEEKQLFIDD